MRCGNLEGTILGEREVQTLGLRLRLLLHLHLAN